MEIIKINQNKLKIMLNKSDMEQYNLSQEDMDYADSTTRQAIKHILQDISLQTGFEYEGSGILVQVFASRAGGCELFVTREKTKAPFGSDNNSEIYSEEDDICELCKSENGNAGIHLPALKISLAYSFENLKLLLKVCSVLSSIRCFKESSAYIDQKGNCYLILDNVGMSAHTRLDNLSFLSEFGEPMNIDYCKSYINEHAKPICDSHAVEILGSL